MSKIFIYVVMIGVASFAGCGVSQKQCERAERLETMKDWKVYEQCNKRPKDRSWLHFSAK